MTGNFDDIFRDRELWTLSNNVGANENDCSLDGRFFVACTATARRSCQIFPADGERLRDTLNIYDLLYICLTDIFDSKYGDFCGDFFS